MSIRIPKTYEPKLVEDKTYRLWKKSGFFNPDNLKNLKIYKTKNLKNREVGKNLQTYTIVIPPPNVTGELHMGHALNATIQDILIRQKRMKGFKTLWLPGTDHAGIATQNVVEKNLKKQGLSRKELGREEFIKKVWQWKEKYGNLILNQLKKIGSSCDWSRTRFTMDKNYSEAVNTAFIHYWNKGWIYQGERIVNWCPRCETSLSDLELEHKEQKGKLRHIRYPLKKNQETARDKNQEYIIVATTRPETMLGDAAVAVNPKDKRYKDLIGKKATLPIMNREIPIIADKEVDIKFGTGAVKITPSHDPLDFEIAKRHKLPHYKIINEKGFMTGVANNMCEGLKTIECRNKVVDELEKQNLVEKIEDYPHQIPRCYRCETIIEPLVSQQWFLKMDELANLALSSVKKGEIKFFPKRWEKVYFNWLKNVKDWNISRQIWWGHRFPVWFCTQNQTGNLISNLKFKNSKVINKYFISTKKPKRCSICSKCTPKQVDDVLDTWFSSALWPFATLGWPIACAQNKKLKICHSPSQPSCQGNGLYRKNQKYCLPRDKTDLDRFYPTQVLSTARDIINLWVTRMIFSGYEFMGIKPFNQVYIHPTVLTKEGKRMSKSLGTGIDPVNLIEKYGADATRFGLIWQNTGSQDTKFSEENFIAGKKFCNKLWNASRFVLTRIKKLQETKIKNHNIHNSLFIIHNSKMLAKEDKQILKELDILIKMTDKDLENFRFGQALHRLYKFFWHSFCDKYIEVAKLQIANSKSQSQRENTKKVLIFILATSLKLLHPFIPFITEEIYQKLPVQNKTLLMIEDWPIYKNIKN